MQFKYQLAVAIGCAGLLALSLPAFGNPASRTDDAAQRNTTNHVPSYVARVLAASKPAFGWPALVTEARKYLGTNPTDRKRLWCATFMNFVLENTGYAGTNSDAARSFASYGKRIDKPEVGAIAVLTRGKRGGHVGVISGVDAHGNPVIISGNHNKRVAETVYPRSRVIAYVKPTRRQAIARRGSASTARAVAPDRPVSSPITELFTALKAERAQAQAEAQVRASRRTVQRQAEVPSRVVQQMPN